MCSEKCIEICRICEPEKFQEEIVESFIGFGYEDEPDAHFVQLQDCGHYFEVKVSLCIGILRIVNLFAFKI
jgi:hypothetical protein